MLLRMKIRILPTHANRAGSVWIFQIRFDSVQFSISGTRFRFLHITTTKFLRAHAVGKTFKQSEAVEAFTPQLHAFTISSSALLLKCIAGAGALLK